MMAADARLDAPVCLPPRPLARQPRIGLPPGTVDTHFHVIRAGAPLAATRSYTPSVATLDEWLHLADSVGIARGVVVQPSVYGFDNSVLIEALRAAPDRLRGIVVVRPELPRRELEELHDLGVRGVRWNTRNLGGLALDSVRPLAERIAPFGWVLQFLVRSEQLHDLAAMAPSLGLPVIVDHLGFIALSPATRDATVAQLRTLLDAGNCYVKISAPYRLGGGPADFAAVASALVQSHPDRLLWGTDWPHTEMREIVPDDADLIDSIGDWLPETARHKILIDSPNALFFRS
jgi:predicted TIM-barrel fold metal-dependent hydrolase